MTKYEKACLKIAIIMLAVTALTVFLAWDAFADDIKPPQILKDVQRAGNQFYRTDLRVVNKVYNGQEYKTPNVYKVLPYNAPAACSNFAAKKIKLLEGTGYNAYIAEYWTRAYAGAEPGYHAVVVVQAKQRPGWWVLDNLRKRPYFVEKLQENTYRAKLEVLQRKWGVK